MNIYLDESYNLQKNKGKMFISINGFAVLHDKALRKRWGTVRKSYAQSKRRVHATDSHFEGLREKSIKLLGKNDVNILSVFQLTQEIPYTYFDKKEMKFDSVYADLLKKLFIEREKKMKTLVNFLKDERGLETVEWTIIAALIVVGAVLMIRAVGVNVLNAFTSLEANTK